MGGKSQKTTTTQTNDPWKPAQPYLKDLLGQASSQFAQGQEYAPFATTVPFSNQTNTALQGIEAKATQGSPLAGQAQSSLSDLLGGTGNYGNLASTARGDFLNANPYLNAMFSSAKGNVQDAVNSQFSQAGRTGSGSHEGVLASRLGDLATNIYGQNYAQERQNQLGAQGTLGNLALSGIGQLPGVQEAQYSDLNKLGQVGAAYEGQAQTQLQDALNRWNFQQETPWTNLQRYAQILGGIGGAGGTQTATSSQPNNTLGQLLGVGAGIAGLATGNPFLAMGGLGAATGGSGPTAQSLFDSGKF